MVKVWAVARRLEPGLTDVRCPTLQLKRGYSRTRGWAWRDGRIVVRVWEGRTGPEALATLIHEVAHFMAWRRGSLKCGDDRFLAAHAELKGECRGLVFDSPDSE